MEKETIAIKQNIEWCVYLSFVVGASYIIMIYGLLVELTQNVVL